MNPKNPEPQKKHEHPKKAECPMNLARELKLKQNNRPMKKHRIPRIAIGILIILSAIPVPLTAKDIELNGMLRSKTGTSLDLVDPEILVSEQALDIILTGWGDITRIVVNPYAYIDADLTPILETREAYIDLFLPALDIRIGKQAVIWGEAEGAFITDIVSPQNMRSFILADFKEIRMGIPAVKSAYYAGPITIEGIWIPAFVPTIQPAPDSLWAIKPDMSWIPSGMTVTIADPSEINRTLKNSEIFAKVSYFGSDINAELIAGSAWDDYPVFAVDRTAAPNITITPTYERYTILGGSLSATLGSAVVRSEAAVYFDRSFNTSNPAVSNGIEQHNQLQALAGVDWSLLGARMSAQYIVQYIDGYDSYMLNNEVFAQTATFLAQNTFFSDTLTARFFGYFGLNPFDALLRPSLIWSIEDGVSITAGAEIFLGDDTGKFGQFAENSMGYVSLNWYF